MRLLVFVLVTLLTFVSGYRRFSATQKELEEFFDQQITDEKMKDDGTAAIAISVVYNNETVFFKGYGFENYEKKRPVDEDTVFGLASISKTFVAVSAMKVFNGRKHHEDRVNDLVSDHNKDLILSDYLIGDYFSWSGGPKVMAKNDIRLKHLVSHTAGFDENSLTYPMNRDSLSEDLVYHMPKRIREPDQAASYSNYGIAYLAELISLHNTFGVEYEDYLKEYIFRRQNMTSTFYGYKDASKDPHFCNMQVTDKKKGYIDFTPNIQDISGQPAGAIYSSSRDMQKWMTLFLTHHPSLMTKSQYEDLFHPVYQPSSTFPSHLDTIFYEVETGGVVFTMHDGDLHPFHASMILARDHGVGITVLMSTLNPSVRNSIRVEFAHRFLMDSSPSRSSYTDNNGSKPIPIYCPNGTVEHKDYEQPVTTCNLKYSLSKHFPRTSSDVKSRYEERFVGCYQNSRFSHTNWVTVLTEYSQFFIQRSSFCLEMSEDNKYLLLRHAGEQGTESVLLIEQKNDLSSNEFYLTHGHFDPKSDLITIRFDGLLDPHIVFRFPDENDKDHRYIILGHVLASFEYYGSESKVFRLAFHLFIFALINPCFLICLCCCCCFCLCPPFCCSGFCNIFSCGSFRFCKSSVEWYKSRNRKKYQSLMGDEGDQYMQGKSNRDSYVAINVANDEEGIPVVSIQESSQQMNINGKYIKTLDDDDEDDGDDEPLLLNENSPMSPIGDDDDPAEEQHFGVNVTEKYTSSINNSDTARNSNRMKNKPPKTFIQRLGIFTKWESITFFCGYCGVQNCTMLCICLGVAFNFLHFVTMYVYAVYVSGVTWVEPTTTLDFASVVLPIFSMLTMGTGICCGCGFMFFLFCCECGVRCRFVNPSFWVNCFYIQCCVIGCSVIVCLIYYSMAIANSSFFYVESLGI